MGEILRCYFFVKDLFRNLAASKEKNGFNNTKSCARHG
jgi:hypothetical protein